MFKPLNTFLLIVFFSSFTLGQQRAVDSLEKTLDSTVMSEVGRGISGSWKGIGTQDDGSTWTITLKVPAKLVVGGSAANIDYPSLNCGGRWTLESVSESKYVFEENIAYGRNNCLVSGTVEITYNSDDTLSYFYTSQFGTANSTLTRVAKKTASVLNGNWTGTYRCGQGKTGLNLAMKHSGKQRKVNAIFSFYPIPSNPSVPSGSFEMTGNYNKRSKRLTLIAGEWISQPFGYFTVDMSGRISDDYQSFAGNVIFSGCSFFRLTKE